MLKEMILTGLGATVFIKDRVEDELKKLKEEGKIDSGDIKGFVESLENKGREQDKEFKEHLKKHIKEVIDELNLATKDDLEQLKKELK
jgi:polyhydroxyalkanoate synthesis regulator phasin